MIIGLETGEVRTGTRDPMAGDETLPGVEAARSDLLIRVDGEPTRVTWSGHLSPQGPTRSHPSSIASSVRHPAKEHLRSVVDDEEPDNRRDRKA